MSNVYCLIEDRDNRKYYLESFCRELLINNARFALSMCSLEPTLYIFYDNGKYFEKQWSTESLTKLTKSILKHDNFEVNSFKHYFSGRKFENFVVDYMRRAQVSIADCMAMPIEEKYIYLKNVQVIKVNGYVNHLDISLLLNFMRDIYESDYQENSFRLFDLYTQIYYKIKVETDLLGDKEIQENLRRRCYYGPSSFINDVISLYGTRTGFLKLNEYINEHLKEYADHYYLYGKKEEEDD